MHTITIYGSKFMSKKMHVSYISYVSYRKLQALLLQFSEAMVYNCISNIIYVVKYVFYIFISPAESCTAYVQKMGESIYKMQTQKLSIIRVKVNVHTVVATLIHISFRSSYPKVLIEIRFCLIVPVLSTTSVKSSNVPILITTSPGSNFQCGINIIKTLSINLSRQF